MNCITLYLLVKGTQHVSDEVYVCIIIMVVTLTMIKKVIIGLCYLLNKMYVVYFIIYIVRRMAKNLPTT